MSLTVFGRLCENAGSSVLLWVVVKNAGSNPGSSNPGGGGMIYGVVHVQLEAGRGWGLFLPTHKFFLYVCLDSLDQILHRHVGIDLIERLE